MTATTAGSTVRLVVANGIARVTLDRAPVNVLTIAMLEELDTALQTAAHSPGVKAVLLSGAGKCFCAGVDVGDHAADNVRTMLAFFHAVVRTLMGLDVPVIAALHGAALGGGMELALACDIVIAADDAKLGQPEIKLGVFPPAAAALLPRLIGRQRAMDLILTGRTIGAAEAQAMGLVSAVVPAAEFERRASDFAAQLAALSAPVLRLAKKAVLSGLDVRAGAAIERAGQLYLNELMALPDAHEGIAAWMAKRAPIWAEG